MASVTEIKGRLAKLNAELQQCNAEEDALVQKAEDAKQAVGRRKKRARGEERLQGTDMLSVLIAGGGRAGMVANAALVLQQNQKAAAREHAFSNRALWSGKVDGKRVAEPAFPATAMEALRATDAVVHRDLRVAERAQAKLRNAELLRASGVAMYTRPCDAPLHHLVAAHLAARRSQLRAALQKRRRRARDVEAVAIRDFAARHRQWELSHAQPRHRGSAHGGSGRMTRDAARARGSVSTELRAEAHEEALRAEKALADRVTMMSEVPQSRPPAMVLLSSDREARVFDSSSLARVSTDGTPARCRGLPLGAPCPPGCNCARAVEAANACVRPWTDAEKLIFLDAFLQYPKDFTKIAAFLRHRSAQDCIAHYYLTKRMVGYKALLQEQESRRKNKRSWHATATAAKACGLTLGTNAFMVPSPARRRTPPGPTGLATLPALGPQNETITSSARYRIKHPHGERAGTAVDKAAPTLPYVVLHMPKDAASVLRQTEAVLAAREGAAPATLPNAPVSTHAATDAANVTTGAPEIVVQLKPFAAR